MSRALVVIEPNNTGRDLLHQAGKLAANVYDGLTLLRIIDEDNYSDTLQRKARSTQDVETIDDIVEKTRQEITNIAEASLSEIEVPYETVVITGDASKDIILEAEKRECDHIFIIGKRRSPTGKAVFGDVAQSVILNFDGLVTITMNNSP